MKLVETKNVNPAQFYNCLKEYFPTSELKEKNALSTILQNKNYKVFNIISDNLQCGYFSFFELPDNTIWLDYFAVNKESQSKGIGTETFKLMKKEFSYNGCYLEVEKKDEKYINTIRRVKFYENLGAQKLDVQYFYPNISGALSMDLYFMPFQNGINLPEKSVIIRNIEKVFENIHFDIEHRHKVFQQCL